ncbi:uncharacterized protein LOC111895175 isoform X1 [Lactuca sativa]|uniref:uncharacterized protein LOC111895175 isoform X1 n=1 Tax=Lactuca sativa TaxID=4236 RepID=UPI000CD89436|nr:uncharacterized protein LOC111895175 isoform X1 [Lactuca sativa]
MYINYHLCFDFFLTIFVFVLLFYISSHLSLLGEREMAGYERNDEFISKNGHEREGATMEQKYGGLAPKKKPLISKDHERAFFDSADWALCKQGAGINEKSTIAIETLRPKLERTPRQCLPPRRPACISGGDNHVE